MHYTENTLSFQTGVTLSWDWFLHALTPSALPALTATPFRRPSDGVAYAEAVRLVLDRQYEAATVLGDRLASLAAARQRPVDECCAHLICARAASFQQAAEKGVPLPYLSALVAADAAQRDGHWLVVFAFRSIAEEMARLGFYDGAAAEFRRAADTAFNYGDWPAVLQIARQLTRLHLDQDDLLAAMNDLQALAAALENIGAGEASSELQQDRLRIRSAVRAEWINF